MADFKSCHDAYRKHRQEAENKQKQTREKQHKNQKDSKQNKGRVISRSVHDVGNLKKGDSIVSSKVSCSGMGMAVKPNKTKPATITEALGQQTTQIDETCACAPQFFSTEKEDAFTENCYTWP